MERLGAIRIQPFLGDMNKFEVTVLGCGCALPTVRHFGSSQVVNIREKLYMVDCGEGTQIQFRRNKMKFTRLNHIFITHLHGDHFFGLIGLISTMSLLGRTATLHVYGPKDIEPMLRPQLDYFCNGMSYSVEIHTVNTKTSSVIFEDRSVTVHSIPLKHRIVCCGYLFKEKASMRHIRPDVLKAFDIPISQINNIKAGMDYMCPDGEMIKNDLLTTPPTPPRSFAYCSDTVFRPDNAELLKGVDLLYHEATFAEADKPLCKHTFHSTAGEAGELARLAEVKRLMIGHFSSRYEDENILLQEAQSVFPETILARENLRITL